MILRFYKIWRKLLIKHLNFDEEILHRSYFSLENQYQHHEYINMLWNLKQGDVLYRIQNDELIIITILSHGRSLPSVPAYDIFMNGKIYHQYLLYSSNWKKIEQ